MRPWLVRCIDDPRMKRTNDLGQTILGWALGLGVALVIAFALVEYAIGARGYGDAADWDPAIDQTTLSDTEREGYILDDPEEGAAAKP